MWNTQSRKFLPIKIDWVLAGGVIMYIGIMAYFGLGVLEAVQNSRSQKGVTDGHSIRSQVCKQLEKRSQATPG